MNIRRFLCIAILAVMTAMSTHAQERIMDRCFMGGLDNKSADLCLERPDGFHVLEGEDMLMLNPDYKPPYAKTNDERVISLHPLVLESDDEDCVLLYPIVSPSIWVPNITIQREKQAVSAGNRERDNVTVIRQKDMSQYSGADVAYIYQMELPQPYKGKYSHCTGIYLRKYAHAPLLMKVITSDSGEAKKDVYMRKLLDSVHYGDTIMPEWIDREKSAISDSIRLAGYPI